MVMVLKMLMMLITVLNEGGCGNDNEGVDNDDGESGNIVLDHSGTVGTSAIVMINY